MKIRKIQGGITAAKGFSAACCEAAIKYRNRKDMAMVFAFSGVNGFPRGFFCGSPALSGITASTVSLI